MPGTHYSVHLHNGDKLSVSIVSIDPQGFKSIVSLEFSSKEGSYSKVDLFIEPQLLINKIAEACYKYREHRKERENEQTGK